MKKFLSGLVMGSDGKPSLMDMGMIVLFMLFVAVTGYLVYQGTEWKHYDTFSDMTVGGGSLMKTFKYGANVAKGIFGKQGDNDESNGNI